MATEPKTGLTFWPPGAMQPDLLFNALLYWLAVWAQPVVIGVEDDPPATPAAADIYIVGVGTGAWEGRDDQLAYWDGLAWLFFPAMNGYEVRNSATDERMVFDEVAGWGVAPGGLSDAPSDGNTYGRKDGAWEEVADSGADRSTVTSITSGATITVDLSLGDYFTLTLAHNATVAFSNPPGAGHGFSVRLRVTQDGTGGRTLAQPAAVKVTPGSDPAIQAAAGAATLIHYSSDDNGTTIDATIKARGP